MPLLFNMSSRTLMNWFCFVNKLRTRRCSLCVIFLLRQLSLTSNTENQPHVSGTRMRRVEPICVTHWLQSIELGPPANAQAVGLARFSLIDWPENRMSFALRG